MPRLTAALPKYRKHKASGQAIVSLHGKDHYLGPYRSKSSKELYERLIAEYCAAGRQPTPASQQLTVVELIAKYWRFCTGYYLKEGKPTSEQAAIRLVLKDVKRLYGVELAESFGPLSLKAVRETWVDCSHSRMTINRNVGRIVRMFKWAVAEELLPPAIHQSLAAVPGLRRGRSKAKENERVLPVPIETVEATIGFLSPIVADMVRVQLLTGARPAEICKLTPSAIDRSGDVWEYWVDGHKTEHHGRDRVIFIGPEAQAILAGYLDRSADAPLFSPAEAMDAMREARNASRKTAPNQGNSRGRKRDKPTRKGAKSRSAGSAYTADSYRRAIHRACDQAFTPPADMPAGEQDTWRSKNRWSPNRLRHSFATIARRHHGLEASQVLLGHASADITQVYAERDYETARNVAATIGKEIMSLLPGDGR